MAHAWQEALRHNHLFTTLTREQLDDIVADAVPVTLTAGAHLFEQGQTAGHFYWVESGLIKLSRLGADGHEKVLELIQPGQTFAEAILFSEGGTYPVNAQAVEASQLVAFPNAPFLAQLKQTPDIALRMLANMSRRLHQLVEEIDRLTLQSATERVVRYLLDASRDHEQLHLDTTKQLLAARLSIKPETLSRIFARLSDAGLITVKGADVTVHNRSKLARMRD